MADANLTGAVALALGAVAISAVPAAAGVVVTPVDLQLSTLPSGTPYLFAADQFGVFNGGGGLYALAAMSPDLVLASTTSPPFVTKLKSGTTISATTFSGVTTKAGLIPSPGSVTPFFAALDIVSGTDNFFGWALFNDTADGGLFFDAYAFETTANTPLTTPSVPEPAGLSLLALGAAGALVVRRRKRVLN